MNVLYVYADSKKEFNCSRWNCWIPATAINKAGEHKASVIYIDDFIKNSDEIFRVGTAADIIVVERNLYGEMLVMMEFWRVRGKPIVTVFDDAYDLLVHKNRAFDFWIKDTVYYTDKETGKEKPTSLKVPALTQFKWGLQKSKAIHMPSQALVDDWKKYNQNAFHVHNYLDWDRYVNAKPLYPKKKDEIIIGWNGGASHYRSFTESGIIPQIRRALKNYKNVRFLVSGDRRIYYELQLDEKRKIYQPHVPSEQWESLIATLDLAIVPLGDEFDKRRSWIKPLEYMAVKVPWIASNFPPYQELKDYGTLVENSNWEEAICNALDNLTELKEKSSDIGYKFAESQSSDNNIGKTMDLYQKIIDMPYFE